MHGDRRAVAVVLSARVKHFDGFGVGVAARDRAQDVAICRRDGKLLPDHVGIPFIDPPVGVRRVVIAGQIVHVVGGAPVSPAARRVVLLEHGNPFQGVGRHGVAAFCAVFGDADFDRSYPEAFFQRAELGVMVRKAGGAFVDLGKLMPRNDVRQAVVVAAIGHKELHLVGVVVGVALEVRTADFGVGVYRFDNVIARFERNIVFRRKIPVGEPAVVDAAAVRLVERIIDDAASVFGVNRIVDVGHDVAQHFVVSRKPARGRLIIPGVNHILAIDLQIFAAGFKESLINLRNIAHRVLKPRFGFRDRGVNADCGKRIFARHIGFGKAV